MEAESGPGAPRFGSQRRRLALLALLASAGDRGLTREKVLAYLWPESETESARNSLSQLLFGVRRELGGDAIGGSGELRLNPTLVESDVRLFVQALEAGRHEDAVSVYGGPFLDGVYLRGVAEFERWCEEQRARYAAAYAASLETLANRAASGGSLAIAAEWWRRRAEIEPTSARVAAAYANALAQNGDRTAAIRHLGIHGAMVRSELGIAPDPSIRNLESSLRKTAGTAPPRRDERVADEGTEGNPGSPPAAPPARGSPSRWRPSRPVIAAGVCAIVAGVSALAWAERRGYEPNSIVVAPFQNETADSALDPLSRIVADWVADGLQRTGLVDVIDSRNVIDFLRDSAGRGLSALAVAQRAAAGTLVSGVIYRRGDSLRAIARIVRVFDGSVLADVAPVSAPLAEPERLIDPLRQEVMGALGMLHDARLERWARTPSSPPLFASYVEYVRGLDAIGAGRSDTAAAHLMHSATLDSSFAQAKIMLMELSDLPVVRRIPSAPAFIDSLERRALAERDRLMPYDQAALDAVVAYRRSDWHGRLVAARQMVAVSPQSSLARFTYGHALIANSEFREASAQLDKVDPDHSWLGHLQYLWVWKITARHLDNDFSGALRYARDASARFPHDYEMCLFIPDQYAAMGRERDMNAAIDECLAKAGPKADTTLILAAAARELRAHGHDQAARRTWSRALVIRLAKTPDAPAPFIRASLGDWSGAYARYKLVDTASVTGRGEHGTLAARAGDHETALRDLQWLEQKSHTARNSECDVWRATVTLALGDRAAAVGLLRQAMSEGMAPAFRLHAVPLLHDLDGYQPFRDLMRPSTGR